VEDNVIVCADCLELMPTLPDSSIDLIVTDPPYMDVKRDEWWDRQWDTVDDYIEWLDGLCQQWHRLLKPYEDLRAEYEYLRRPFTVTAQDQYTDVWDFPTVKAYPGKHPCEKPLELYEHIVKVSSREGDLVADFFCGSGVAAEAAMRLGRRYFCCDIEQKWVDRARVFQLGMLDVSQGRG
jgi:DNA modification methylase